jgi:RNA polymerase sigma-70 factor (ECF subfamily)
VPDKETASFEGIYKAHHLRVQRLCRILLKHTAEAEETAQEVFLKMFRQYQSDNWPDDWGAWISRVTVNACHDRRKSAWWKWWRTASGEVQLADYPSPARTPEQEALGREQRDHIGRAFQELSRRQQEVFALRYFEGWSTDEVAKALAISEGSVKNHLFRAVRHLRAALRKNGDGS